MIDRYDAMPSLPLSRAIADLQLPSSVEKKERDLLAMYKQVVKDKTKIEETVAVLDEHKKDTLEKTWEKVNK